MDLVAAVEAERQAPSRELVGAAMCTARARAAPPAGVESLNRVAGAVQAVGVVAATVGVVEAVGAVEVVGAVAGDEAG